MKKRIYIFFLIVIFMSQLSAQVTNDYRTSSGGNWTDVSIWQIYNGSSWIAASFVPGTNNANANNVTIIENHTVNIGSNLTSSINSVTIGDENGNATSISTLNITADTYINTSQFTIAYDGLVVWNGNHDLNITQADASFSIAQVNPYSSNSLGIHHGIFVNTTGCNVNKRLIINSNVYSNCNGGGSGNPKPTPFETLNILGGNLSVNATVDNEIVCKNSTIQLTATLGGENATDTSPSYDWIVILPSGDTEAVSTDQNPTTTITEVGTHTFEVTFTNDSGITAYNTVQVIGRECKNVVTNRRITYRVTPVNNLEPVPTLPLLSSTAYNIQRYRDNGSNDERLDFSIANTFNFSTLQVLVSDVEYSSLTVQSFNVTNPNEDLYSSSSPTNPEVISGPSSTGTGYDHLFILTGTSFSGNRTINITIDTPSPNGSIDCGGSCPKVSFYGL